jgi:hypothetical protein
MFVGSFMLLAILKSEFVGYHRRDTKKVGIVDNCSQTESLLCNYNIKRPAATIPSIHPMTQSDLLPFIEFDPLVKTVPLKPPPAAVPSFVVTGFAKPPTLAIIPPSPSSGVVVALGFPVGVAAQSSAVSASVVPSTTTLLPPLIKLISVPLTVIAGPPAFSVCVPTKYSAEEIRIEAACVFPLTTTELAPGRRENVVPETVIAGAPAMSVCVPTRYCVGDGDGEGVVKARGCVVRAPITRVSPLGAR